MRPDLLILWDIDRTLIDVSDLIRDAMSAAAADVLGTASPELAPIVGRPESASMRDTLRLGGMSAAAAKAALPRALEGMTAQLAARAPRFPTEGRILPGVPELLTTVGSSPGVVQSVLTGSLRENAVLKLDAFGLSSHFDLDVGAFGDDAFERPALVDIARHRAAERYHTSFDSERTLLIGDSVHDVGAARATGAHLVAVATGVVSSQELNACGAQVVLDDLTVPYAVSAILVGGYPVGEPRPPGEPPDPHAVAPTTARAGARCGHRPDPVGRIVQHDAG